MEKKEFKKVMQIARLQSAISHFPSKLQPKNILVYHFVIVCLYM